MTDNAIIFDTIRPWLDSSGFNVPGRIDALNGACDRFRADPSNLIIFEEVRPWLDRRGFTAERIAALNAACDALRGAASAPTGSAGGQTPPGSDGGLLGDILKGGLDAAAAGAAGVAAAPAPPPAAEAGWPSVIARLTNKHAAALTEADFARAAQELGVGVNIVKAVRAVEAPRGAFDDAGRPTILYEKHVFSRATGHRFDASHPMLSAPKWEPGTYGPASAQYGKLERAWALDPDAAFKACSWGAFQILGENAVALGYPSAFEMAIELTKSEAAHLDSFIRFVKTNRLVDELQACRAGDPASCVPFVRAYNGAGYARNNYHVKFAQAAKRFAAQPAGHKCGMIGDSIALGIAQAHGHCDFNAVVGRSSAAIARESLPGNYEWTVISAGSNDPDSRDLEANLQRIRAGLRAAKVVWILPMHARAAAVVRAVASAHGDKVQDFTPARDGVHPRSYGELLRAVQAVL